MWGVSQTQKDNLYYSCDVLKWGILEDIFFQDDCILYCSLGVCVCVGV
jgi:hypothetical protein